MIRISLFLRKIAWMAALIAMSASCVLMLLVLVGGFGGNFLPVFANLIMLIVCLGVLGGGVVLLALKKRAFYVRYAPAVLVGFTVYLLINMWASSTCSAVPITVCASRRPSWCS